jgi:trk system potassium uptake protein TrkA
MKCCIIGLGVFGKNLAINLAQLGAEVLAIDRREENVSLVKDEVGAAIVMDFEDPSPLGRLAIPDMDAVVIAIGDDFESSMAMTVKVQELGARRIVCRVLSPMHARLLRLMKVDRLVVPEEVAARGLAHSLLMRGVVDGFDMGSGHAIIEAAAPKALIGKNLLQTAALFKTHHVRLVTIKRKEPIAFSKLLLGSDTEVRRRTLGVVDLNELFASDDVVVLFGSEKGLRLFLEENGSD